MQRQIPLPKKYVHQGPTVQQWYIYPTKQWDIGRVIDNLNNQRYITAARVYPHQGATVQRTDPILKTEQPQFAYYRPDINRYVVEEQMGPYPQLDGPTRMATHPVPPVNQPDRARWYLPDINRFIVEEIMGPFPQLDGAIRQQTYVFTPNQPDQARYRLPDINRYPGAPRRLDGPTTQQTYIFTPNQPERRYYVPEINSLLGIIGPKKQLEGATSQQTYVFPLTQPRFAYYLRVLQFVAEPPIDGGAPVVTQTDIYRPIVLPDSRYYVVTPAGLAKPNTLIDNETVMVYVPPANNQPQGYGYLQLGRFQSGIFTPISPGIAVKNYYTGANANQKRGMRGMGF